MRHRLSVIAAALALFGCAHTDSAPQPAATMRRLTQEQYRASIADIFGADIKVAGRFEPELRSEGLLAVGTTEISISPSGFEQYTAMARTIAAQVVDEQHRAKLLGCEPSSPKAPDDACATSVLRRVGHLLFRRPLADSELKAKVKIAGESAATLGNFYSGLQYALAGLLVAPDFLFRVETAKDGGLDGLSKASRLSFMLWNTTPDEALLTAAERGELNTARGLQQQVDRLMASPQLEAGVRAFFADMLGFDQFDDLAKDTVIYPAFSLKVANDSKEQTLRTVVDHVLVRDADYRDLFTTRRTFMSRPLGIVYRVPVRSPDGWEPYEFAENDPRAGLLTQISFVALHSHPGRSSATLRGKALRELLLCQTVPPPPNNVNFTIVQDTTNPKYRTARERLTAHRTDAVCAGCHKIVDPIGLALENFDGIGQYRAAENDAPIDASGELDGQRFTDAVELGRLIHDNPSATSCLAGNLYKYGTGHKAGAAEQTMLNADFAASGYRVRELLRRVVLSDAFTRAGDPGATMFAASTGGQQSKELRP